MRRVDFWGFLGLCTKSLRIDKNIIKPLIPFYVKIKNLLVGVFRKYCIAVDFPTFSTACLAHML